LWREYNFHI